MGLVDSTCMPYHRRILPGLIGAARGSTMKTRAPLVAVAVVLAAVVVSACGSTDDSNSPAATGGTGGASGTGGAAGANTGGSAGFGGSAGVAGSVGVSGSGGVAGSAGAGGTEDCSSCGTLEQCFNNQYCVAKLIPITGGYSIDATEVTRCQYGAWLATTPSTTGQVSACAWNDSYEPGCEWPPGSKGDHPVACVDWCDAYAYCQAAGKRLCGKIGGGANGFESFADAAAGQWYAACSSGGVNGYPYGNTYNGSVCNGDDAGYGTTVKVGSMASCQSLEGGYSGVFDLSGNVWEWEDSCEENVGSSDFCRLFGGSFASSVFGNSQLRCEAVLVNARDNDASHMIGFRCCSP